MQDEPYVGDHLPLEDLQLRDSQADPAAQQPPPPLPLAEQHPPPQSKRRLPLI